jgi:hypothetical protein
VVVVFHTFHRAHEQIAYEIFPIHKNIYRMDSKNQNKKKCNVLAFVLNDQHLPQNTNNREMWLYF